MILKDRENLSVLMLLKDKTFFCVTHCFLSEPGRLLQPVQLPSDQKHSGGPDPAVLVDPALVQAKRHLWERVAFALEQTINSRAVVTTTTII